MSRVPSHARQGLHNLARGQAKALDRSRGAGASALRAGLSKLPRLATSLRTRCDDEPGLLHRIVEATVPAVVVTVVEQGCWLVRDWIKREHKASLGAYSQGEEIDLGELQDFLAGKQCDCTECECGDCQCKCHGDEEE